MQVLPLYLATLVARLVAAGMYPAERAPNHVLVNDYRGGVGIPAHADGELYWYAGLYPPFVPMLRYMECKMCVCYGSLQVWLDVGHV